MNRVVLYEPEKPANVGNIIRTCMCLKAALTVVGYTSFDLSDKALKRAGMDYLCGLKIELLASLDELQAAYPRAQFYYVTRYSDHRYTDFDLGDAEKEYCFVFGRESTGLPKKLLRDNYERTMRIPMAAEARSLNLANSVAMVLGEATRQQDYRGLSTYEVIKGRGYIFDD